MIRFVDEVVRDIKEANKNKEDDLSYTVNGIEYEKWLYENDLIYNVEKEG